MPIRLLTLDCANTLLKGQWNPVGFALWAARESGLDMPPTSGEAYATLLRLRYPSILSANRTGDYARVQEAYVALGAEWLSGLGIDPLRASDIVQTSRRLLTSPESGLFEPYEDAVPFLRAAREKGVHLAVASNWDASLPCVLAAHGLKELFDDVFASLVVGAEKPLPTMICLAMRSAKAGPGETLHVGDDPTDDLGAAEAAGVRGVLIDRAAPRAEASARGVIRSLMEILPWID